MEFIKLLQVVFIAGLVYLLFSQIIIPAWCNRTLFPLFQKTAKLEQDMAEATQDVYDARLSEMIEKTRLEAKEAEEKAAKAAKAVKAASEGQNGNS